LESFVQPTDFLVCPACRSDLDAGADSFACATCNRVFAVRNGVPLFDPPDATDASKNTRREYWDTGWEARYAGDHAQLAKLTTRDAWRAYIAASVAALPTHVQHVEAGEANVRDKTVIDIGCGGGISSATFGYFGARYIGVDHSLNAATIALRHLRCIEGRGFTVQANAEALPIRSGTIDMVYSNGVLHHTPNFGRTLDEVHRVLKPGGKAVIALYATYSTEFGLLRLRGLAQGYMTRKGQDEWMSRHTEGAWRTEQRVNQWSETFSAGKLRRIVGKYGVRNLAFRKNGSPIGEVPLIGRQLLRLPMARIVDGALEPRLGSMIIMSFEK
jgi:SAM-dependent methyltransferase